MKVRVHRAEVQRGEKIGVLFGRAAGMDVYALDDVLWVLDLQLRLRKEGKPIEIDLDANKVARLPR